MTNYTQLIERLNDAWATHTGCESSESVMSQAIEDTCVALEAMQAALTVREGQAAHWRAVAENAQTERDALQARIAELTAGSENFSKSYDLLAVEHCALQAQVLELEAENAANMETCQGMIRGLASKLAALEGQEPVAWVVKFDAKLGGANVTDRLLIWRKDSATEHVAEHLIRSVEPLYLAAGAQAQPLTNGEIYTAYIEATNQTLRPQDGRLAFAFARAIEKAHGIGGSV